MDYRYMLSSVVSLLKVLNFFVTLNECDAKILIEPNQSNRRITFLFYDYSQHV